MEKGLQRVTLLTSLINHSGKISSSEKVAVLEMIEAQEAILLNSRLKRYDLSVAYMNVVNMHDAFTFYVLECREEGKEISGKDIQAIFIDILL